MIAGDEKKGSGCEACGLRRANATSLSDGNLTPSNSCSRYDSGSGGGANCPLLFEVMLDSRIDEEERRKKEIEEIIIRRVL